MKIVFMGTPDFSAVVLEKLNSIYPVSAVVTGPDKPSGRGYKMQFSPLKQKAIDLGIPVLQYAKVSKEGLNEISALNPDVVVTAAFGQILSDAFLNIPKYGVLNVHASLLPKLRGAAPIQWAIINGEKKTGITIMRTVKKVDAGDILLKKEIEIGEKETAGELFDRLAVLGGEAIVEGISLIESGKAVFTPQNEEEATHCSMISKLDGYIDFTKSAGEIDCFVRGMTPWPSAVCPSPDYSGMMKVFKVASVDYEGEELDGTIICADKQSGIVVKCAGGAVRLESLQVQGGKRMSDVDYLLGHKVQIGSSLLSKVE